MRILRRFLARLLNLTATPAQDDRLKEEIEGHIAMQTQENIRAGLSPVEARRRAILKFGGVEGIKQEYRARRGLPLVENFLQDVRFAIRGLRRTPGLTAFVVVTLALGIGMTSATFRHAVQLLPVRAHRARIWHRRRNDRVRLHVPGERSALPGA